MSKQALERLVITVELHPGSVRIVTAYYDRTGLVGVRHRPGLIPPAEREFDRTLSDLLDLDDDVVRAVRLWIAQGRLF